MIQILFAFLAGILTIAAPCILPMLPIILGASVGQKNKLRPLFIVMGFVVSFAAASLLLSALITHLGLSQNLIRNIAIVLLLVFAFFMHKIFTCWISGIQKMHTRQIIFNTRKNYGRIIQNTDMLF